MYELSTRDRNWSTAAHLAGGLLMFLTPSFGFLGPGLVWLINQDKPDVVGHARDAFKFQVAMTASLWLCGLLGAATSCILIGPIFWLFGFLPWLAGIFAPLRAAHRVNNGERYGYPITGHDAARLR
jgi:uncharacterized Tic20 family protein